MLEDHNRLEIVVEHPVLDDSLRANEDDGALVPGGLVGGVRLEKHAKIRLLQNELAYWRCLP